MIKTYDLAVTSDSSIDFRVTGQKSLGTAHIVFCELSRAND